MIGLLCALVPMLGGCDAFVENAPSVSALIDAHSRFDHETVAVAGRVARLDQWHSKAGPYLYETFYVCQSQSCVRVFREAHSPIHDGETVRVRGQFFRAFHTAHSVYRNEIEAREVITLK